MFPVLLLMVVIRACLLFPKRGRFVVAGFAYAAFLGMLWLTPPPIRPFHGGVLPNGNGQPISLEQWHSAVFNLSLNSALLFGFVLLFVLLLVGALLAEHQSREELAAANQRLLHYSLLIENQATLQERSRIAREIHDSVGHALTAQSIQLENAQMFLQTDLSQTAKHLEEARSLGRTALKDVRQSVSALRTDPLQGKSLAIALQHLIQDFQKTTQIPVRSQIQLPVDVPADFSRMLYRIIQEALTNVAKHSDATQVWLSLTQAPTHLDLCIHDNGRGFDPAQNSTGFGLQSIQERTEAIGGYLALDSAVGQGCQLQIRIPFR
jgi:signal transduction histidine kinase